MDAAIVVILIVLNIPVYKFIFKAIFKDNEDFRESAKYSFTPDTISLFRGKYWKDKLGEMKISVFIFACIVTVLVEFLILQNVINFIIQ